MPGVWAPSRRVSTPGLFSPAIPPPRAQALAEPDLDAQRSYRETALAHLQALGAYLSVIYQLEAVGRGLAP